MTENKRFTITQDFEEHHRQIRDNGYILMGCFVERQAEVIVDLLNQLNDENEQLKLDNDIKFWKQEYLQLSNHQQVIFHELAEAFKQGYKPSKEYQKMRNDEKKRIEECKQKMERLRI